MLVHAYNIIIDNGVGSLEHGRKVVDGLNTNRKNVSIHFNGKYATELLKRVWKSDENAHLNQ